MFIEKYSLYIKAHILWKTIILIAVMADNCVRLVDGKRGGRNSNVLLNGFRYSKRKVNKNGSVIYMVM